MKISKRILAALLACMMTVSMFGITASAEGVTITQINEGASTYAIPERPGTDPTRGIESEYNDSRTYANPLASHQMIYGSISSRGDSDYYRIQVPKAGKVETWLESEHASVTYRMWESDGDFVGNAIFVGADGDYNVSEISFYINGPATLYLEVIYDSDYDFSNPDYFINFLSRPYIDKFVDVQPGRFYYYPVQWADSVGITGGVDDTHFAPNQICTRAQLVSFLWRYAGCPMPEGTRSPFRDVTITDYYYFAVLWAVERGITSGLTYNYFGANDPCTRGQMVTFLWSLFHRQAPSSYRTRFVDVSPSAYYYDAVLWAVERGITRGVDAYHFDPYGYCTRGQAVTFINKTAKF